MIKNIIFDLDGTISKSAPGILNAFEYALEKMGKHILEMIYISTLDLL